MFAVRKICESTLKARGRNDDDDDDDDARSRFVRD